MAYMKDSTGKRLDSFAVQPATTSPAAASWHRQMREAAADSTILVVGDSTGASLTRWPRLVCNKLATAYPTWTIKYHGWDDPTKTYPVGNDVTVQTGTNGRTLHVYNASVSGQVIGYAQNNIGSITSGITPNVILFNYGHNSPQLTDDYRAIHASGMLSYISLWPNALVASMTQNPRAVTDPEYAADQGKQRAIYEMSVAMGLPLIDVNEAFRQYGNYAADLLNPDGLHPNDTAGSPLWADLVWDAIKPTGASVSPGVQLGATQLWVPATNFMAATGTPTLSIQFGNPVWALDDTADEAVVGNVSIPSAWKRQNINLFYAPAASNAGNVVWSVGRMYLGGSVTMGTFTTDGGATHASPGVAGKIGTPGVYARTGLSSSAITFRVQRTGSSASDTMAGDALFLGLMIERAY